MSPVQPGGLYPIIRRLRRPLVIQDDDAEPAKEMPAAGPEGDLREAVVPKASKTKGRVRQDERSQTG